MFPSRDSSVAQLSDFDPLSYLRHEGPLPPEPHCDRLSDVLKLVEGRLDAALLDAAGRSALHRVTHHIPSRLSGFWGLELRLGDPAPRADLLWQIRRKEAGILTLAAPSPEEPATGEIATALRERSLFWQEFGRFAKQWLASADWSQRLSHIWMEVDTASVDGSSVSDLETLLDRPNLFWGPTKSTPGTDRDLLSHLTALGHRFYGLEVDGTRLASIAHALPGKGSIFQMGVMGARATPVARLCVSNLDEEMKVSWLTEIGWPGDRASLRHTFKWLKTLGARIELNVDVLPDGIGPRLGLEIYCLPRTLSMEIWEPLYDRLRAGGLARVSMIIKKRG